MLRRVKEERSIQHIIRRRKANRTGHNLRSNCLLKHVIEVRIDEKLVVNGRRRRRRKQLLDDLKTTRGFWKSKEEALARTLWRTSFGRGRYGMNA